MSVGGGIEDVVKKVREAVEKLSEDLKKFSKEFQEVAYSDISDEEKMAELSRIIAECKKALRSRSLEFRVKLAEAISELPKHPTALSYSEVKEALDEVKEEFEEVREEVEDFISEVKDARGEIARDLKRKRLEEGEDRRKKAVFTVVKTEGEKPVIKIVKTEGEPAARGFSVRIPEIRIPDIGRIVEDALSHALKGLEEARSATGTRVVSSIRIPESDAKLIDFLTEAGVFSSRSEAIAYFTHKGIQASRDWLEKVKDRVKELMEIQEAVRREIESIKREIGEAAGVEVEAEGGEQKEAEEEKGGGEAERA
ncbi:MAG: hypothetical protein DRN96_02580 [Thermoproteota archaeon]|nr:MAG: hypothetical protein DRN96_02580 [Candidatus Korarchaeota archaeon]